MFKRTTSSLLTKESRTRLARMLLVVSDVFPYMMQEILLNSIPPRTLYNMIQNDKTMSDNLKSKEKQIVQNMYQRSFTDVDVTLAYKLLKYFNLIPIPTQKWGRIPRSCDVSVSDDVERIHHFRNSLFHRASKEVSEAELLKYFTDFSEIGSRLDTYLQKNPGFGFFSKISSLQTHSLDAETEMKYLDALEEINELKLQLRHTTKNNTTFNLYYARDFESKIQETFRRGEDKGDIEATLVIHGCENEENVAESINRFKEYLNSGKYTIKLKNASCGCLLLYISIQTKHMTDKHLTIDVEELIENILDISEVACNVTAALRFFDVILDTDNITASSTRQDEWQSTYNIKPAIHLDVGIQTKTLKSSTCLRENVIGFVTMVTDVLDTENKNNSLQGQHAIDVIVKRKYTVKISDDAAVSNANDQQYVSYKPLFSKLESNFQQSRDKKEFVATYNFIPVEECDLELQQGEEINIVDDTRDGWWLAQNKAGKQGYIPSNYIKEKIGLEIFNESKVKHHRMKVNTEGLFYIDEPDAFQPVQDVIHHYKHESGGLSTRLRCSPAQDGGVIVTATAGSSDSKYEIDSKEIIIEHELCTAYFGNDYQGNWNGKVVAVKMINELAICEDSLIKETIVMKRINHTNLVQFHGIVTKGRPIKMVTELMPCGYLSTYLRRHKYRVMLDHRLLLDMCSQVCNGMAYLEKHRCIHRDLQAKHCMIGDNMVVKVADFGLPGCVFDKEYTIPEGKQFPVKWAAPEVLNFTRFSSKSDVWAFGVLMWEIYTGGELPYGNMKNVDVFDYVCQFGNGLEQPTNCPTFVYEAMLKGFDHEAAGRPSFQELLLTLVRIADKQ